jgi:hypothetical protein
VTKKIPIPRIKPLEKFVSKARDLRDAHEERHRPTGFGFALADKVDYLDADRWDTLTKSDSLFFSRRYLRVLEDAAPDNLQQRYALIFRGREPVAAVAAQLVTISLSVRPDPTGESVGYYKLVVFADFAGQLPRFRISEDVSESPNRSPIRKQFARSSRSTQTQLESIGGISCQPGEEIFLSYPRWPGAAFISTGFRKRPEY